MFTQKMKRLGIAVITAAIMITVALSVAAKNRRLSPADNCSIYYNDSDLQFESGYIRATGYGYYVCGVPNDSYMTNTTIHSVNVHLYSSSVNSSYHHAAVCTRSYNGDDMNCVYSDNTTANGERTLSISGLNLSGYGAYETHVIGNMDNQDKLRLIYVTE